MKLDQELIDFMENAVKTGKSVDINNIVIEEDMMRGVDDERSVVLYQTRDVPSLPFGAIGLNRNSIFLQRIGIAKARDNFTIDVTTAISVNEDGGEDEFARALVMKGDGIKIDYRCTNPTTIHAPRTINDTLAYGVELNAEAVSLIQKGKEAMGAESITFTGDDTGVHFVLLDVNSDALTYDFVDTFDYLIEDAKPTFSNRYPVKVILSLFKQNPDGQFKIGTRGILCITINNLDVFVLPQV